MSENTLQPALAQPPVICKVLKVLKTLKVLDMLKVPDMLKVLKVPDIQNRKCTISLRIVPYSSLSLVYCRGLG